jgi:hypothetical protein
MTNIRKLNTINVEVDGKLLYKKESSGLFSVHLIPAPGDTFQVNLKDEKPAFFQVLKRHFVFAQVPSYDGSWDQAVILRCKRLGGAL